MSVTLGEANMIIQGAVRKAKEQGTKMNIAVCDSGGRLVAFARMDGVAMAIAMASVFALGLFLATAVLLIQGAAPGGSIGPNLGALSTFMPGFSVTWAGALVGALYAAAIGAVVGYVLSVLWNLTHILFVGFAVMRANWLD